MVKNSGMCGTLRISSRIDLKLRTLKYNFKPFRQNKIRHKSIAENSEWEQIETGFICNMELHQQRLKQTGSAVKNPFVACRVPASLSVAFLALHTSLAGLIMARLAIVAAQ